MEHGKLKEMSLDFAAGIIHLCDSIDQRTVIKNQLLRSGTSIGANIHEAEYAYSKADFAAKMQIALKECNESEYWLELWKRTIPVVPQELEQVQKLAKRLRFLLVQSLTKVKPN